MLDALDTTTLKKLRAQLRSHIPGDATHQAAVSTLLGALVDAEIADRPADPDPAVEARKEPADEVVTFKPLAADVEPTLV